MDIIEVDHYAVLNLPSGEQGAKLSPYAISKAYKKKALELHPDKRPNDPNSVFNFQKLKTSYDILKDEKSRKLFDALLREKREKIQLRERAAAAARDARREEKERSSSTTTWRELEEQIARTPVMHYYSYNVSRKRKLSEGFARIPVMRYSNKVARKLSRRKLNKEASQILSMYSKKNL